MENKEFVYAKKNLAFSRECDVLVIGGGLGGVSAAIASARAGAKTVLMERNTYLGGVATAGHCCSVFNCFYSDDRRLIVNGLPFYIVNRLAEKAGPGLSWQKHPGHMIYDVELAKLTLAELLDEEGVEVLLDATLSDVIVENNKACGAVYSCRNGLEAIKAKRIVDATGDSDAATLAGAPIHTLHSPSSYCFRIGNVDTDKFVQYFIDNPGEYPDKMDVNWSFEGALKQYRENGTLLFPHGGGKQLSIVKKAEEDGRFPKELEDITDVDAMQMHAIRRTGTVHIITGFFKMNSLDSGEIAKRILQNKKMAVLVTDFFRENMPGFENCYLCSTADDIGIRASRYIDGDFVYENEMRITPSRFEDSIGKALIISQPTLNKSKNAWSVHCMENDYCEIPLRALLPKCPENIIMGAGRSISARNPYYMRVMVNTMVVGQGAGVVAAISASENKSFTETDYAKIRAELVRQNVYDE